MHCNDVKKNGSGGARAGMGDQGLMHPIGTHINISGDMVRYRTSSDAPSIPLLAKAVAASATIAAVTIPGVLRVAQDLEKDSAMIPVQGSMDGDGKFAHVGHSMDLSVNLSNSSHYDVNDGCQGFSIWTEDNPGSTKNLYFVLPNVEGQFPNSDRKFSGIAIALRHGVLISRDRRLLRHCTSHVFSVTAPPILNHAQEMSMGASLLQKVGLSNMECNVHFGLVRSGYYLVAKLIYRLCLYMIMTQLHHR